MSKDKPVSIHRRSIALPDDLYETITRQADRRKTSAANIVRGYIIQGLSADYYEQNDDKVRQMLHDEISAVLSSQIERLIKLQLKSTKTSGAALYALISLLSAEFLSEVSAQDLLANAFKQTAAYMKTKEKPFDEYVKEAQEFLASSNSLRKKDDDGWHY